MISDGDLMGAAEAAAYLGVTRQRVLQLLADPASKFPQPVAVLKMGKVWNAEAVRRWAEQHRPPPQPSA